MYNNERFIKNDKSLSKKEKKLKLKELNKEYKPKPKEKYKYELFAPFCISGNFCFTYNQVKEMLDDKEFWNIYNYSLDAFAPEEWVIQNYWYQKYLKNNKYKTYNTLYYFWKKKKLLRKLKTINLNDFIFLRYSYLDLKRLDKYLKKNELFNKF